MLTGAFFETDEGIFGGVKLGGIWKLAGGFTPDGKLKDGGFFIGTDPITGFGLKLWLDFGGVLFLTYCSLIGLEEELSNT